MRIKSLWGISAIIQIVITAVLFILLILLMNCDKEAARYFLWTNGEIIYKNGLNDVSKTASLIGISLSVPLLIVTVIGAVTEKAKAFAKIIAVAASVVMTLVIFVAAVSNIFIFSKNDPFYPNTHFYEFDAKGVPVVIAERSWGLGDSIEVYRLTDDGHARSMGFLSDKVTYLPHGRYEVDRDGDTLTVSYYQMVRSTDTEENSPKISTTVNMT